MNFCIGRLKLKLPVFLAIMMCTMIMAISCNDVTADKKPVPKQINSESEQNIPQEESEESSENNSEEKKEYPRRDEREKMVRIQIKARGVNDETVLETMRTVPRHEFVPDYLQSQAYDDNPLPIGYGQTISQPFIVGLMTEALKLDSKSKVLEVGTGSGYQAAVLAEITDQVYTIEIIEGLYRQATSDLNDLGYDSVTTKHGDGYYGWEDHAPFDAIIVTAAASSIPPPLIKQLKADGRMIIPVGAPHQVQRLVLVTKNEEGRVKTEDILTVRFVPLTRDVI